MVLLIESTPHCPSLVEHPTYPQEKQQTGKSHSKLYWYPPLHLSIASITVYWLKISSTSPKENTEKTEKTQ